MLSRAEGAELLGGGIDLDLATKPRSAFPAFSQAPIVDALPAGSLEHVVIGKP